MFDPWRRKWQPTPVFLPGGFHEQRSQAGYRPYRHKLDTTERHTHTHTHTHRVFLCTDPHYLFLMTFACQSALVYATSVGYEITYYLGCLSILKTCHTLFRVLEDHAKPMACLRLTQQNSPLLYASLPRFAWNYLTPGGSSGKESACQWRRHKRHRFQSWVGKISWKRKWQPISVFLPVE